MSVETGTTSNVQADEYVLAGTSYSDFLVGTSGNVTLSGGGGNDTYYILGAGNRVVEGLNGGYDTVYAWIDYTLTANIEKLFVGGDQTFGIGNDLDNTIIGGAGSQQLYGGNGNDTLTGGSGDDVFIVTHGSGSDIITDFSAGPNGGDLLQLGSYGFTTFDKVLANMSQSGNDVVVHLNGSETVTLQNHSISDFAAGDFQYALDTSKLVMSFADDFSTLSLQSNGGNWATSLYDGVGGRTFQSANSPTIFMDQDYLGLGVNPFSIENGVLTIHAEAASSDVAAATGYDFTGGLLTTRDSFSQTYGYFEIKCEMPAQSGTWPAFWLLPADGSWPPEIDIFENVGDSSKVYMTSHTESSGEHTQVGISSWVDDVSGGMHTYGMLWSADELIWYVDGVEKFRTATPADMHSPMYLVTNLAVGGDWPGSTDASFTGADFNIDYIRAYQLSDTATENASMTSSLSSIILEKQQISLVLTGDLALNGTGNALDNILVGNDGNNILNGLAGADTMRGGAGDDTYFVDNIGDVVTEGGHQGIDTVKSTISYALASNVENLNLLGSANIDATGNELANSIIGNSGNNVIDGGTGADTMKGDSGDDTYYVDNVGDVVVEWTDRGLDTVYASVSYQLASNVENLNLTGTKNINATGNGLDNTINGNAGDNIIDGGMGLDIMAGGVGNDTYYVDKTGDVVFEKADEGIDTVKATTDYILSANIENLILQSWKDYSATGNELNNTLIGNSGNNTLNGMAGADIMQGGYGNDRYYVDNIGDVVTEWSNQGIDTVYASISYALTSNVENLTLSGSDNINATGNGMMNTIFGNAGNNVIDGGAGADIMKGDSGDDTYIVDNVGDVVVEWTDRGIDTVLSSISYTLTSNVENLVITGSNNVNATGNWLNNIIVGNAGNNIIDGGMGLDTMAGGAGNDTYYIDKSGDIVIENAGEGIDTIKAMTSYTLPNNVENLVLLSVKNLNATGNELDNSLYGNDGNNILNGLAGADTMKGGAGDDSYFVDNSGDVVTEWTNQGIDTVNASISYTLTANVENLTLLGSDDINAVGNGLSNIINGNSGNNVIDGGAGADIISGGLGTDILTGGTGNDIFMFRNAAESTVTEYDTITDFRTGDLIDLSNVYGGTLTYRGATDFTHSAGEVHVESHDNGVLVSLDLDGNGVADMALYLDHLAVSNLSATGANFIL